MSFINQRTRRSRPRDTSTGGRRGIRLFFRLGVWTLGGSDWRSVFALVATLLAKPADRVVGLAVGVVSFILTDSAASHWCFFVSFYAAFVLIYAFMVRDPPKSAAPDSAEQNVVSSAAIIWWFDGVPRKRLSIRDIPKACLHSCNLMTDRAPGLVTQAGERSACWRDLPGRFC